MAWQVRSARGLTCAEIRSVRFELDRKGGRARTVPLWWDAGTLEDLRSWKEWRVTSGAVDGDLFLCTRSGGGLDRQGARRIFQSACRSLGPERHVTIHDGRHSFVSHALASGRDGGEGREAAGHSNLSTTRVYSHLVREDDGVVGSLFG